MMNYIYRMYGKRCLDLAVGISLIVLLAPLLIVVAALVPLDSRGSCLFVQWRGGRQGRPFAIYKFRTMTTTGSPRMTQGETLGRTADLTRLGYWLRRFKIDELPQLFNVLKGDMSLVGPRPWLTSAWDECDDMQRQRFHVRPGLTGLAQVNGNIHLSREDRLTYDLQYVADHSLSLDLRVLGAPCWFCCWVRQR